MNVLKQLDWTSTPKEGRKKAPKVVVKAKKLKGSALKITLDGYMQAGKTLMGSQAFYEGLYQTTSGPKYVFPYFGDSFRQFTNDFADTLSNVTDRGQKVMGASALEAAKDLAENVASGFMALRELQGAVDESANPGSYIETPKFYQFANTDQALQVQFPLLNTVSREGAKKNQKFIKEFTKLNRPHRANSIAMSFPHIYEVRVPGLRFIKWAYLSDLSFGLLGTRRMKGGKILPEGYTCSMTFNSLTVEVANFMDQT